MTLGHQSQGVLLLGHPTCLQLSFVRFQQLPLRVCSSQRLITNYPLPCCPRGYCKWICSSAYPRTWPSKSLTIRKRELEINKQVNKLSVTLLCFKAMTPTLLSGSSECICCVSQSEADRMGIEGGALWPCCEHKGCGDGLGRSGANAFLFRITRQFHKQIQYVDP